MSLVKTDLTAPGPEQVLFFTERNFQGQAYLSQLGAEVDIYRKYHSLNDKLLSAKVGSACKVEAFYAAGFGRPSKFLVDDVPNIDVGGMSAFIALNREGHHAILFTFKDATGGARRMTLQSAGFGSVIQPNPEPEEGVDPNIPRAFATLKLTDIETKPIVTAIFVRKANGEYESPNGSLHFYWKDGKPHAKNIPEYDSARLTHTQQDNVFHFVWE
jgi:hypothetical protein